jgi:hypothetical protein
MNSMKMKNRLVDKSVFLLYYYRAIQHARSYLIFFIGIKTLSNLKGYFIFDYTKTSKLVYSTNAFLEFTD